MSIVMGIVVALIGAVVIYFSAQIVEMFGRNEWAERNMGGTRQAYVLTGFAVVIIGALMVFGVFDPSSTPLSWSTTSLQWVSNGQ